MTERLNRVISLNAYSIENVISLVLVAAVHRISADVVERVVHPAHVPLHPKSPGRPMLVRRVPRPRRGLLGDGDDSSATLCAVAFAPAGTALLPGFSRPAGRWGSSRPQVASSRVAASRPQAKSMWNSCSQYNIGCRKLHFPGGQSNTYVPQSSCSPRLGSDVRRAGASNRPGPTRLQGSALGPNPTMTPMPAWCGAIDQRPEVVEVCRIVMSRRIVGRDLIPP